MRVHNFEDEEEVLEWQLAENLHRKELNVLERADAYARLAELRKKRFPEKSVVKGIAMAVEELTGTKPAERTVRKYLEINRKIKNKAKKSGPRVSPKKVGIHHLEQISRVSDEDIQAHLLDQTARNTWSVKKAKEVVDAVLDSSENVQKALLNSEITKDHLIHISKLPKDKQDRVLAVVESANLTPKHTKKVFRVSKLSKDCCLVRADSVVSRL